MVIFLWVLAVLAAVARYWLIAAVMCVAAIALGEWRKHSVRLRLPPSDLEAKSPEVSEASETVPEGAPEIGYDESFGIDLTDGRLERNYGWDRWTLYPPKNRLRHSFCGGGPPHFIEVWDYRVDDRSVSVRLMESCEEEFEGPRYSVFDNKIVPVFFEDQQKRIPYLAGMIRGEKERAEKMLAWTSAKASLGPLLTYFILGHSVKNEAQRAFIVDFMHDEVVRLRDGFRTVEKVGEKLGAIWNAEYSYFEAPEGATEETKMTIHKTLTVDDGLLQFGVTAGELANKERILDMLSGFLSQSL